ncbi:MAG: hypothetical protein AAF378_17705 [Cyanobacteria bacterium P01_A01_bin.84]
MSSRLWIDKKNNREAVGSTNATEGMFQERPFVVRPPKSLSSKQPNQKTSLQQAKKYGHNLGNTQPGSIANPTQNTKVLQAKPDEKKSWWGKEGAKTTSNILTVASRFSPPAVSVPLGATSAALRFGASGVEGKEGYDANKKGDKVKTGIKTGKTATTIGSGAAAATSAAATSAGALATSAAATGAGGIFGITSGAIDIAESSMNIKQEGNRYKALKGVAGNAANQIKEPQAGSSSMKELRKVLESANGSQEGTQENTNDNEFNKQKDILSTALYSANEAKKNKRREKIHLGSGAISAAGGTLGAVGGFGGVLPLLPVAAGFSLAGGSVKPALAGARKLKKTGRDKGLRGFNQDKTSKKKAAERQNMMGKMAQHNEDSQMKTVIENSPSDIQKEVKKEVMKKSIRVPRNSENTAENVMNADLRRKFNVKETSTNPEASSISTSSSPLTAEYSSSHSSIPPTGYSNNQSISSSPEQSQSQTTPDIDSSSINSELLAVEPEILNFIFANSEQSQSQTKPNMDS